MTVKMAIPNKGRLNERAIELLTKAGIDLGPSWGRSLNIKIPNLDLEVIFVRAQDIPVFIQSGAVDFGITGQDVAAEVVAPAQMQGALAREKIAFLVGFESPTAAEMKTLRDYSARGGKLVVFHSASTQLGELMGVKPV